MVNQLLRFLLDLQLWLPFAMYGNHCVMNSYILQKSNETVVVTPVEEDGKDGVIR